MAAGVLRYSGVGGGCYGRRNMVVLRSQVDPVGAATGSADQPAFCRAIEFIGYVDRYSVKRRRL